MTPHVIKTWGKKLKSANKSLKHLMTAHHKERAFLQCIIFNESPLSEVDFITVHPTHI